MFVDVTLIWENSGHTGQMDNMVKWTIRSNGQYGQMDNMVKWTIWTVRSNRQSGQIDNQVKYTFRSKLSERHPWSHPNRLLVLFSNWIVITCKYYRYQHDSVDNKPNKYYKHHFHQYFLVSPLVIFHSSMIHVPISKNWGHTHTLHWMKDHLENGGLTELSWTSNFYNQVKVTVS